MASQAKSLRIGKGESSTTMAIWISNGCFTGSPDATPRASAGIDDMARSSSERSNLHTILRLYAPVLFPKVPHSR